MTSNATLKVDVQELTTIVESKTQQGYELTSKLMTEIKKRQEAQEQLGVKTDETVELSDTLDSTENKVSSLTLVIAQMKKMK